MDQSRFRFQYTVPVRFKDIDIGGHAHHSHALVYFEEARAAYWRDVVGRTGLEDVDYILAELHVRYHARVLWPQELRVGVRVSRLGKRHFEMAYEVRGAAGDLLVSGSSTQVMYDYEAGRAKALEDGARDAILRQDGPFGPGGRPADDDG
ncbi:MAG TPA: thioesterase family protein [Longimicrobiales bacterium]|nr:thioesterase family protein [Longimicrobiales bacterium]